MFANKTITLLIVAIISGVLAALLAVWYLKAREAALRASFIKDEKKVEVIVAARDLVKGATLELDPNKFAVRTIPESYVHTDAISYALFEQLASKKLVQNVGQGKTLLASFVEDVFPRDFSDTIPLNRRAMTIQVDEVNSVNGFIRPGNRIDVLVNLPAGVASEDAPDSVLPVLENLEVLATSKDAKDDYEEKLLLIQGGIPAQPTSNFTSITVNVSPREAALLETAQSKGDLLAILRNRSDDSSSGFTEVVATDLRSNAEFLVQQAVSRERAKNQAVDKALTNDDLIISADGTVRTKDGRILEGVTVDANGNLIDENGDSVVITESGAVLKGVTLDSNGNIIDENGNPVVVTQSGAILKGVTTNEDGQIVLADGTLLDPEDVIINADGTVTTRDGQLLAGVTADISSQEFAADTQALPEIIRRYDFIIGGVAEDGVATVNKVPFAD